MRTRRLAACLLIGWASHPVGAVASDEAFGVAHATAWQSRLESVHLPGGEHMGLVTSSWLVSTDGWWWGPSVAAAATGHRGGLFVLGGQVGRRWVWRDGAPAASPADGASRNWLETSLMAGGGGGAAAPVGGGLMLAPSLAWMHDWGGWQTGVSWSQVSFPGGAIRSRQWGLVWQWDGRWRSWPATDIGHEARPGEGLSDERPALLGWHRVMAQATSLSPRQGAHIGLIGVVAERDAGPGLDWTLESAAATRGGADGYMELLGGAVWRWGAPTGPTVGARAALGLGGGGAVPTGGGLIGKLGLQVRAPLSWALPADLVGPGSFVQVEAGGVAGPGGRTGPAGAPGTAGAYRARYASAALGWDLSAAAGDGPWRLHGWQTAISWQRETQAARKVGGTASLDTIGVKLRRDDDTSPCYLTGQAHSAVAGGAGAYSLGLLGLGCATPAAPWRIGAEVLAGAAGGGGVATQGGAVAGAQAWLERQAGSDSAWHVGLGRLRSLRSGTVEAPTLDTPVIDVGWTVRFGQMGER